MKRKSVYVVFIAVVAAMAFFNVNVLVKNNVSDLPSSLLELEALAEEEKHEWNDWPLWGSQGFTKDEREEKRPCPIIESGSGNVNGSYGGGSVGGGGSHSQVNPNERYEIICPYGYSNCTSIGC